jgi:hypothetical protein
VEVCYTGSVPPQLCNNIANLALKLQPYGVNITTRVKDTTYYVVGDPLSGHAECAKWKLRGMEEHPHELMSVDAFVRLLEQRGVEVPLVSPAQQQQQRQQRRAHARARARARAVAAAAAAVARPRASRRRARMRSDAQRTPQRASQHRATPRRAADNM